MVSRCDIGVHKWNGGCTCAVCGEVRDKNHDWQGCKCAICGERRDEGHDWDGCLCRICGQRKGADSPDHDWNGCTCRKCGFIAWEGSDKHDWNGCTCRICGKHRREGHDLDEGCRCRICGNYEHDLEGRLEEWADEEEFEANGGGLENMWMMHQVRTVYVCRRCGKR